MFTIRNLDKLFDSFRYEKSFVFFPHRLITYHPDYLKDYQKKSYSGIELDPYYSGTSEIVSTVGYKKDVHHSCCSDLLNCTTRYLLLFVRTFHYFPLLLEAL